MVICISGYLWLYKWQQSSCVAVPYVVISVVIYGCINSHLYEWPFVAVWVVIYGCISGHCGCISSHLSLCEWTFVAISMATCCCIDGHLYQWAFVAASIATVVMCGRAVCGYISGHLRLCQWSSVSVVICGCISGHHSSSNLFISQLITPQVMFVFLAPTLRGHSTRESTSSRVTHFILQAYTGTGVSLSQHRKKSGEVLEKMQVNGPEG